MCKGADFGRGCQNVSQMGWCVGWAGHDGDGGDGECGLDGPGEKLRREAKCWGRFDAGRSRCTEKKWFPYTLS